MRTIYFYLCLTINLIWIDFKKLKYNNMRKHNTKVEIKDYLYKLVTNWSNYVLKIAGLDLTVVGKENVPNVPCVFVGNHQSNFDIPAILANTNRLTGVIAKKNMEKIPIMSYWMRKIHCVFMDRENPREALKSISEGIENLKDGYSMLIFPEGTRSRSNNMGEFKKGSMRLAIKAGVPIVPITIYDTHKAMEGNDGKIKKANAKIIIGKPIYTDHMSKEEKANIGETVKSIIQYNLDKERIG
ncbi:lysophospholipid acyltransferase family protein [Clostridium sp.]|uniref:lysophospholipid acyltransferase family protein n=1 Tax=Clostridium sp. TaxID=1506 RepID=UPI003D6CF92E